MADDSTPQTTYLRVAEVAEELRLSPMTVCRLIKGGQLVALRLGHRTYRIPTESYLAYKAKLHTEANQRAAGLPAHIPGQTEIPT